jgi:hypothetical protein
MLARPPVSRAPSFRPLLDEKVGDRKPDPAAIHPLAGCGRLHLRRRAIEPLVLAGQVADPRQFPPSWWFLNANMPEQMERTIQIGERIT